DTPWKFRANRRAQEDRKMRAAEQVVLETESSPNNKSTVTTNTASEDDVTERPLPSSRSREGRINATDTTAVAFGSAPSNSHKTPTPPLEEHHDPPSGDREVLDSKSTAGHEAGGGVETAGAGGHEILVDVSRRPARAHRKYAEEELDRYCESSISSTATKMGPF
ncbi:unnamed protein product, partial [Ectocarpus sp. 12 AP-2014]